MAEIRNTSPISDAEFAAALEILKPDLPLAVAVSGGADSMALLMLTLRWVRNKGAADQLLALSVDHGLRESSAAELEQVARWCATLGVSHATLCWRGAKPTSDIQAIARRARYGLLTQACRHHGIDCLLLGHQVEDQAETFLLRLARGSGVDGLSAMQKLRAADGVRMLRPLLDFSKLRLRATLALLGQEWLEDSSNKDRRFARVRLRQMLEDLSSEGLSPARLAATAARMQRVRGALEEVAESVTNKSVQWDRGGFAHLTLSELFDAPEEIVLRVLAKLVMAVGGKEYPPRLVRLEGLLHWLWQMPESGGRTLSGCLILPSKGRIIIMRELAAIGPEVYLSPGQSACWDGRFRVQLDNTAPAGGVVRAVGSFGLQQVRRNSRHSLPLSMVCQAMPGFWQGSELMAAPLLGYHNSERLQELSHFGACFLPLRMNCAF